MNELEQLRKELNELRERIAMLENRVSGYVPAQIPGVWPGLHMPFTPLVNPPLPYDSLNPPFIVTCGNDTKVETT